MSVWWFIGLAIAVTLIARRRSRQIQREAARRELLREHRLRVTETLWPGSDADRWPAPSRVETPGQRAYVDAGVAEAEQWANHG